MNRIEKAATHQVSAAAIAPLEGQFAAQPIACTPTLGIFFAAASLSYLYNRNANSKGYLPHDEVEVDGGDLSLDAMSSDELIATRRDHAAF